MTGCLVAQPDLQPAERSAMFRLLDEHFESFLTSLEAR